MHAYIYIYVQIYMIPGVRFFPTILPFMAYPFATSFKFLQGFWIQSNEAVYQGFRLKGWFTTGPKVASLDRSTQKKKLMA